MKFYKIIDIKNNKFIGVGNTLNLRYFQQKHKIIIQCKEDKAQYVEYNGELYRDYWMPSINNININYNLANIIEIEEEEYNNLKVAIDNEENIILEDQEEDVNYNNTVEIIDQFYNMVESPTLEYIKNIKIKEMKNKCKQAIISGIDVLFEDGVTIEHFDLTIEDQINLNTLRYNILQYSSDQYMDEFIFHCKDGDFKYYSRINILRILDKMDKHILYHNAYFNSLKKYINILEDYITINNIKYGDDIPDTYKSEILIELINRTNTNL